LTLMNFYLYSSCWHASTNTSKLPPFLFLKYNLPTFHFEYECSSLLTKSEKCSLRRVELEVEVHMQLEVGEWLAEIACVLFVVGVVSIESRGIPFSSFHSFLPCSLQPLLLPPIPFFLPESDRCQIQMYRQDSEDAQAPR